MVKVDGPYPLAGMLSRYHAGTMQVPCRYHVRGDEPSTVPNMVDKEWLREVAISHRHLDFCFSSGFRPKHQAQY